MARKHKEVPRSANGDIADHRAAVQEMVARLHPEILGVLRNEQRLGILAALSCSQRPLKGIDIADVACVPQPTTSNILREFISIGLVCEDRIGKEKNYWLKR